MDPVSLLGLIPTAYKLLERLYDPKLKEKEQKKVAYNLIETSLKSFVYRWKDFSVCVPFEHPLIKGKEIAQTHKDLFLDIAAKTDSIVDRKMVGHLTAIAANLNTVLDHVGGLGPQPIEEFIRKGGKVQGYCEKALGDLEKIKQ